MNTFLCPHCNQEIESVEQEAGMPQQCPHCGKSFDLLDEDIQGKEDVTFSEKQNRIPVLGAVSLILGLIVLATTIGIWFLFYHFTPSSLYRWNAQVYPCVYFGILCAVVGIVTGHVAPFMVQRNADFRHEKRRALVGLLLCYSSVVFLGLFIFIVPLRFFSQRIGCFENLEMMHLYLYSYVEEQENHLWPQLSSEKGHLIFSNETVQYLDPLRLICPVDYVKPLHSRTRSGCVKQDSHAPEEYLNNSSYCYLGYAIRSDREMRAFVEAYKKRIAQGLPFDEDLEVVPGTGTDGGDKIIRLREHDVIGALTEAEKNEYRKSVSDVAVIWDQCSLAPDQKEPSFRHPPNDGICILFMDRSIRYVRYGEGIWPLTEETLRMFWELEHLQDEGDISDTIISEEDAG